jgi:hypothetical protein
MVTAEYCNRLRQIKSRLLLTAETAKRIANGQGATIELDDHEYQLVMAALLSAPQDLRYVLAELDMLLGKESESWDHILLPVGDGNEPTDEELHQEEIEHGRSETVDGTGDEDTDGSSEGEQRELAGTGSDVRPRRANRKKASRPYSKSNKKTRSKSKKEVD